MKFIKRWIDEKIEEFHKHFTDRIAHIDNVVEELNKKVDKEKENRLSAMKRANEKFNKYQQEDIFLDKKVNDAINHLSVKVNRIYDDIGESESVIDLKLINFDEMLQKSLDELERMRMSVSGSNSKYFSLELRFKQYEEINIDIEKIQKIVLDAEMAYEKYINQLRDDIEKVGYTHQLLTRQASIETRITLLESEVKKTDEPYKQIKMTCPECNGAKVFISTVCDPSHVKCERCNATGYIDV